MILQKNFIRVFTLLTVALLAAAALGMIWQVNRVRANRPIELNFGAMSLNAGQTIRFNVVNPNGSPRRQRVRIAMDIYSLGGPDTFTGSADGGGGGGDQATAACTNNLRYVRREYCAATLLPGEAVSMDFTAPSAEIRVNPVLILEAENSGLNPVATLEIREGGRTLFIHPGAASSFNPQPDPPANPAE